RFSLKLSAFANTDGGYLFIGLDGKNHQIIGFEAKEVELEQLREEIEKCIRQLPVTHFCEEKQQIKYKCRFIQVLRAGAVCSYVCALRVERFCCAVFAAEPDSWHVEDNCVKRFTTQEWVKLQMDATPVIPVKFHCGFRGCTLGVLCTKLFSEHERYKQLLWTELGSLHQRKLVIFMSWASSLDLQERKEVILNVPYGSQKRVLTLSSIVLEDEELEGDSPVLRKLDINLKNYCKQIALTLKQILSDKLGFIPEMQAINRIKYLGKTRSSISISNSPVQLPQQWHSYPRAGRKMARGPGEILGSYNGEYSFPSPDWKSYSIRCLDVTEDTALAWVGFALESCITAAGSSLMTRDTVHLKTIGASCPTIGP
ncbi:schlafen 4, partial [Sigmodon hispidus]